MAKGLRSKVKRANRAAIREKLTIPLQKIRQEAISQNIKDSLNVAKGKSIRNLKSVLDSSSSSSLSHADEASAEIDAEAIIDDAKEGQVVEERVKSKKRGSKPRNNPGKELVWFK